MIHAARLPPPQSRVRELYGLSLHGSRPLCFTFLAVHCDLEGTSAFPPSDPKMQSGLSKYVYELLR